MELFSWRSTSTRMQEHGSVTVNKAITAITSLPDSGTPSTRYVIVWFEIFESSVLAYRVCFSASNDI
jgi:hypothetical protein